MSGPDDYRGGPPGAPWPGPEYWNRPASPGPAGVRPPGPVPAPAGIPASGRVDPAKLFGIVIAVLGILNFVFGHLWLRPGLSRRDRRLITIPSVGVGDAFGPIWSHVTSALGSGDVSPSEMEELIVHFSVYAGTARAKPLHDVASQWQPPTE